MKLQERLMAPYRQKVRWKLGICYAALLLTCAVTTSEAQSLKRVSIGVAGVNMVSEGILIKQTIGQPYATTTSYSENFTYTPGFQQPTSYQRLMQVNEGITYDALNVSVYPNPTTHAVKISSTDVIKNGILKVHDSKGRILLNEKIAQLDIYTINCENWRSGIYMITIVDEQNIKYTSKLIITK